MQRGLVNYRAGQQRIAVRFQRDGQALKPFSPPVIQVSLDADLVALWLVMFFIVCLFVTHHV